MQVVTRVEDPGIEGLLARDEFFWLDLNGPSQHDMEVLGGLLGLHPMAMEDTHEFGQRPKVDVYERHLLVVFYTARAPGRGGRLADLIEVHIYVSGGWIVTIRQDECTLLDRLHEALRPEGTHDEESLVYRIFDTLTDAFYPVITDIESRIDALEAQVLARARREQLGQIYRMRQDARELHRVLADQRDHFKPAADAIRDLGGLSLGTREYLRDVGDHLAQVTGELHRQNEDLLALASTYFNANADRLNAVATRLTVMGTFFLVWTLVTGFFGQNFGWLVDNISTRRDFIIFGVGGLTVPTLALVVLFVAKRRDWF